MDWQFKNDLPIYTQLVSRITFAIVAGELLPGQRLASVREMAAEAGVNPNTLQRAMQELERGGLVFSQRSTGRYVTEDMRMIENAKKTLAQGQISEFMQAMSRLGYTREEIIKLLTDMKGEN